MSAMRSPENNAKGTSGQSFVKGQFEEIGWGVAPNLEHDLGTDLWLMARDARRFDLGALVGAQVKNWALEFDAPATHEGQEGWWFSDSAEHFDYWLGHRVPHIQVFYDREAKVSYWVHITPEATVSTGKQRKILVPKSQTVDAAHFDDLITVATSGSTGQTWEGSAWLPGQQIPDTARLRYAMIVPRLIAPHGNSSVKEVSAEQAVALLTAYRLWEIDDHLLETQPLLAERASLASEDPLWKLYGALRAWVVRGDLEPLKAAFLDVSPEVRAAHTAMLAAALFEDGDARQAAAVVEAALNERDDYNPVDHAWLTLHLARNYVQIGRLDEARTLTLNVIPIGQTAPSDPTARFLTGVASDMLFSLSGWQAGYLAATIQARDNAASWWRSQTMTTGLAKYLETSFEDWSNDASITFKAFDETWTRLRSTTLISGFGADSANWGHEASLLAQYMLMRNEDATQIAAALSLLRVAGAVKQLKLAVEYLLDHGPIDGIQLALEDVHLELSTRGSLQADLELVGLSSHLFSEEDADRIMTWLLAEVADPAARVAALGLRFLYPELLWTTIARLYVSCSEEVQAAVRRTIAGLSTISDQSVAHQVARALANVRSEDWSAEDVEALASRAEGDNFELANAVELIVARRDPAYRSNLLSRISEGDIQALSAWGDVRQLPREAAQGMIVASAEATRAESADSKSGAFAFGGPSAFRRLILLNIWHPELADWAPCIEALDQEQTNPNDILPGLELMLLQADSIPSDVRDQMHGALNRLSVARAAEGMFGGFKRGADLRGAATELLASLFPQDVGEGRLLELLGGSDDEVRTAVRVYAAREDPATLPLFAALAAHDETHVRAAVAAELGSWVAKGIGGDSAQTVLRNLLQEPGVRLATHVTRAIASEPRSDGSEVILELLSSHPSALVRLHVQVVSDKWESASTED